MRTELPDDIDQIKVMLRKQQARLHLYAGQIAGYEQEIDRLRAQLDKLRRLLFGQSSEKSRNKLENKIQQAEKRRAELEARLNAAKSCLDDEQVVPKTDTDTEAPVEKPAPASRPSSRKPLPAQLPRETRRILQAETVCPFCSRELKTMGKTVSEQLEIINTAFTVIETLRPKLACSGCDTIAKRLNFDYNIDMSYSIDFCRKVLSVKEKEGLSIRETAKRFHIGLASLSRWLNQIDPKPSTTRQRKIDKSALEKDVELYPDAYQKERAERFGVCQKAICQALKKLGRVLNSFSLLINMIL